MTFPTGCKELMKVTENCLREFRHDERYKNDVRYIQAWLNYVSDLSIFCFLFQIKAFFKKFSRLSRNAFLSSLLFDISLRFSFFSAITFMLKTKEYHGFVVTDCVHSFFFIFHSADSLRSISLRLTFNPSLISHSPWSIDLFVSSSVTRLPSWMRFLHFQVPIRDIAGIEAATKNSFLCFCLWISFGSSEIRSQ